MRIIDKKHDFYDYLQDSTDSLVFDRRSSFNLNKMDLCRGMFHARYHHGSDPYRFLLMQCGATFWLFLVTLIGIQDGAFSFPTDCSIELLCSWKNYDKPNTLLKIRCISFPSVYGIYGLKNHESQSSVKSHLEDLKDAVDHDNIFQEHDFSTTYKWTKKSKNWLGEKVWYTFPILAPSGLGAVVDPVEMFTSIEEFFSIEKQKSETTEPKGATNNDKITMHGFDTRTSFRGKADA